MKSLRTAWKIFSSLVYQLLAEYSKPQGGILDGYVLCIQTIMQRMEMAVPFFHATRAFPGLCQITANDDKIIFCAPQSALKCEITMKELGAMLYGVDQWDNIHHLPTQKLLTDTLILPLDLRAVYANDKNSYGSQELNRAEQTQKLRWCQFQCLVNWRRNNSAIKMPTMNELLFRILRTSQSQVEHNGFWHVTSSRSRDGARGRPGGEAISKSS